jgi:hypothetical protein
MKKTPEERIPGYAAYLEARRAWHEDKVRPVAELDEMDRRYPHAAIFLMSEQYAQSPDFARSVAGDTARDILLCGGSCEEAADVLDRWTEATLWV